MWNMYFKAPCEVPPGTVVKFMNGISYEWAQMTRNISDPIIAVGLSLGPPGERCAYNCNVHKQECLHVVSNGVESVWDPSYFFQCESCMYHIGKDNEGDMNEED